MKKVFIVNKASRTGKAEAIWNEIEEYLKGNNIAYQAYFTHGPKDATEYSRMATSSGEEVELFVMGGDGTLNEALNGIADFDKTVFIPLPSGSANDFVKGVGIKGEAISILKNALSSNTVHKIDIGRLDFEGGSRLFGVSSGIGVDAYVCLQALDGKLKKFLNRIGLGSATYGLYTIADILTMPFSDAHISLWFKDKHYEKDVKGTIFAAAMNCKAEGGGIPMAPKATVDSGYLTAFYAHDIGRLRCFGLLPFLVMGRHEGRKGVELLNFDKIHIIMKKSMCVHADGEHVGFFKEITFECLPQTLKIRG